MILSPVLQLRLVFISVMALTITTFAAAATTDPCYNYAVLDDPRRATSNPYSSQLQCDAYVSWSGWYRLFIQGQSAQMPDTCVDQYRCGTIVPLWLNGGHPTVEDGVVTRVVCGSWSNNCCYFQYPSNPIKVKACPGNYYVYEFVRSNVCPSAYCAEVTFSTPTNLTAPGIFYPFGSAAGDTRNAAVDDGSSSVIPLLSPFLFFGRRYQQIYVNNNGHLTFNQSSSQFVPYSFPANGSQDIIAGLWTNLDNRARGVISYHQYTNGSVLTRATLDINNHFPNLTFSASWVFVATWDKAAYFPNTSTETSFQVVLISGSNFSFILMNYGDIAVTVHPVEAGYDTVNSFDYFVIPGSNNGSFISNLKNSSNVNVPGRWAFRVDSGHSTSKKNVIGLQVRFSSVLDLTQSGNTDAVLQQLKQELVKNGLPSSTELKLRYLQKIKP
ncbi:sushi, nidogen and EGF-like domain-containing protein 1 [Megalobrama amblycephala]|uniref:sushi, nidogen and EGF-like domain-containing protein 1 n=1 Tax=Megalobrama amblycephala TaxID=75352 RepID=UPI002013D892|nr:sushi, nidogen and EGF-like domain-containing protein 1 [Megalobrama amblycephala]